MPKTILQEHQSCSVQKTARKNTKYPRNEMSWKIGHLAKAIAFAKWSVCVKKLKMAKLLKKKPFYKNIRVVLCEKSVRKNTKYWRNETILKIGQFAKAIAHANALAFAKCSVWVKNYNCQKHAKNHSTRALELFCEKSRSRKH